MRQNNPLRILITFVNVNLYDLLLTDHLVAVAGGAAILGVDVLPLAFALGTDGLDLLHHARPNLLNKHLHPSTFAHRALFNSSFLPTIA